MGAQLDRLSYNGCEAEVGKLGCHRLSRTQ